MNATIFSQDQLDTIVNETLPALPEGHTNAVVAGVDQNGARIVGSFSLGQDQTWQFQVAAEHDWTGDNKVGGKVVLSW